MKPVFAVLLTALVSFVWGVISWTQLGWHQAGMSDFKDEAVVGKVIQENAGRGRGIYMLPFKHEALDMATEEEQAEMERKHEQAYINGPYVYAVVRPGKTEWTMRRSLIQGFVRSLLASIILAVLMSQLTMSYPGKLCFTAAIGVFVGLAADVPDWIWFELPGRDLMVNMADHFFEWALAGSVLAFYFGKELNVRNDRY